MTVVLQDKGTGAPAWSGSDGGWWMQAHSDGEDRHSAFCTQSMCGGGWSEVWRERWLLERWGCGEGEG